jgi:N-acetylglucosamine malate deacetylase 1
VRRVLFVLAHQDDEYGAAPWIVDELRSGSAIACVYLTDGGSRVEPAIRDRESLRALDSLGISGSSVFFARTPNGRVPDQHLAERALDGSKALEAWLSSNDFRPDRIYAPSYEGGHPDHDAAHVIAVFVAQRLGLNVEVWHFSLYNGCGCPKPFFAVLRQLPGAKQPRRSTLSLGPRLTLAFLCRFYPSQLKTWIGLFPGAFMERVLLRREAVARSDAARLSERPHSGELLYERMFGFRYADFARDIRPLVERLDVGESAR